LEPSGAILVGILVAVTLPGAMASKKWERESSVVVNLRFLTKMECATTLPWSSSSSSASSSAAGAGGAGGVSSTSMVVVVVVAPMTPSGAHSRYRGTCLNLVYAS
jgi:hypothetical protein